MGILSLFVLAPQKRIFAEAPEATPLMRWNSLTPERQAEIRKKWLAFQALPVERRERLRRAYQRFRALSADRQSRIRRGIFRYRRMTPHQRRYLRRTQGLNFKARQQ